MARKPRDRAPAVKGADPSAKELAKLRKQNRKLHIELDRTTQRYAKQHRRAEQLRLEIKSIPMRHRTPGNRILRAITFEPEHKQAGIAILSYFGRIVEKRFPNMDVRVQIEQEELDVRLVVETPSGIKESVERTLHQYGKVVVGESEPSDLFDDELSVLELRNKLELARTELRMTKELMCVAKDRDNTIIEKQGDQIREQERQIRKLMTLLGKGLEQSVDTSKVLQNTVLSLIKTPDCTKVIEEHLERLHDIADRGISEGDENDVKNSLRAIAETNTSVFQQIYTSILGSAGGSLLASWTMTVANTLPK